MMARQEAIDAARSSAAEAMRGKGDLVSFPGGEGVDGCVKLP
jgi:hypothetical protein